MKKNEIKQRDNSENQKQEKRIEPSQYFACQNTRKSWKIRFKIARNNRLSIAINQTKLKNNKNLYSYNF